MGVLVFKSRSSNGKRLLEQQDVGIAFQFISCIKFKVYRSLIISLMKKPQDCYFSPRATTALFWRSFCPLDVDRMGWTLIGRGRVTWGAAFAPDLLQLSGALLLENPMLGVFMAKKKRLRLKPVESLRLAILSSRNSGSS